MRSDSRTLYIITHGSDAIEISETGYITTKADSTYTGLVEISITFPTYSSANHISTFVSLNLVAFSHITTSLTPYPNFDGAFSDASQLGVYMCSNVFEVSSITVTGHLSDGTTSDITNDDGNFVFVL